MKSTEWMTRAKCADPDIDPEMFFPDSTGNGSRVQAEQARRVCMDCPVRGECDLFAKTAARGWGVWGGVHRSRLPGRPPKVVEDIPNHGTDAGYARHARRHERACEPCLRAHRLAYQMQKERRA